MKKTPQSTSITARSQAPKAKGILVLGMHRSGTSAMARALNLLGCALPNELVGAADGNELGHWESMAAVHVNDEILASAGSSWEDWGPINADWGKSGLRSVMVGKIAEVINDHANLGPLFVLKDPRICRLADLWLDAMDLVKVEPCIVLMMRNPTEVTASLESRDLMAPGYARLLWLRHTLDAEYFSRGRKRVVARYDQLMSNWHGLIEQHIKPGLDVALPRNAPAVHLEIDGFLDCHHQHQNRALDEALNDPSVSGWLKDAYRILLRWSKEGESASDHAQLDQIRTAFNEAYGTFGGLLLPAVETGEFAAGSRLKRELTDSLATSQRLSRDAEARVAEAEEQKAAVLVREGQLRAELGKLAAEAEEARSQAELREVALQEELAAQNLKVDQLRAELATVSAQAEASGVEAEVREGQLRAELGKLAAEAEEARSQAELREVALQEELAAQNLKVDQLRAELGKLAAEAEEARSQAELREVALQEKFTEQTINTAELSGRLALAESMLSQRQEELSQVWSDLLNKEAQLSANAATRGFEQERQAELERCLAETKVELANEQSALAELRQETAAKLASRFSEIAELTQALMRAEVVASEGRAELVAKDAALQSATADLMTHISQNNELLGQLSHAQDELAKSKQVHATAEQQIKMRHNEIAQLTKILAEQSAGLNNSAANNVWLREMMMVMARMPRWWALLPSNWRRKREHALYRRAGLFDVNEYLSTYPDVAEDGMDPVRHYILHGIEEARRRPA